MYTGGAYHSNSLAMSDVDKNILRRLVEKDLLDLESLIEKGVIEALGHLYQQGLEEAEGMPSQEVKRARLVALERDFKLPALQYLALGQVNIHAPEYAEGLIAFYEKRYPDALNRRNVPSRSR